MIPKKQEKESIAWYNNLETSLLILLNHLCKNYFDCIFQKFIFTYSLFSIFNSTVLPCYGEVFFISFNVTNFSCDTL